MNWKAIGTYIVVKQLIEDVKTDSGIMLTASEASGQRYQKGVALTIGNDCVAVGEGDTIYYDTGRSHTMMLEGQQVTIIRESDVVVVV